MRQYMTAQVSEPADLGGSDTGVEVISRRALKVYLFLAVLLMLLSFFVVREVRGLSLKVVANIVTVFVVLLMILLIKTTSRGLWSASALYLLIFSLFHFGTTAAYGLGIPFSSHFVYAMNRWFYSSLTIDALLLAFLGFFATAVGVYVALLIFRKTEDQTKVDEQWTNLLNKYMTGIGFLLLSSGVFGWFLLTGGMGLLFGAYRDYLDVIAQIGGIGLIYFMIALGLPFLASSSPSRWQRLGYLLFAVWAFVALPLGLRGEVLFPMAAAIVVVVRKGFHLPLRRAAFMLLILLVLIGAVRQVRQVGLRAYASADISLNPVDAIVEMGGSLRPVTEVVKWRAAGEDYIYGASYWAPVERMVLRFVPGGKRLDAHDDDRLMNVLVQKRVGPIGFSPIAEAFRNFGIYGVFFIMLTTGVLLGWLDQLPVTTQWNAVLGAIYVPLLIQIRNAFIQVPFQWLVGIGIILVVYIVAKSEQKKLSASRL